MHAPLRVQVNEGWTQRGYSVSGHTAQSRPTHAGAPAPLLLPAPAPDPLPLPAPPPPPVDPAELQLARALVPAFVPEFTTPQACLADVKEGVLGKFPPLHTWTKERRDASWRPLGKETEKKLSNQFNAVMRVRATACMAAKQHFDLSAARCAARMGAPQRLSGY